MNVKKLTFNTSDFPEVLRNVHNPPKQLYVAGNLTSLLAKPRITIIGSRKVSTYGKDVTVQLATQLARAGVVIVSGLALGVDSIAHKATLEAGGLTLAVLPGSLDRIYPASHYQLAVQILRQGGALISEYPPGTRPQKWSFIERNRIASGISQAVLITEAAEKSGTLHTARFALDQGKDVLAVPGNITSPGSAGTNNLIRAGAVPVTCAEDVLHVLGINPAAQKPIPKGDTPQEQIILSLMAAGEQDGGVLLAQSKLDAITYNQTITMLEITGKVRSLGGDVWTLA